MPMSAAWLRTAAWSCSVAPSLLMGPPEAPSPPGYVALPLPQGMRFHPLVIQFQASCPALTSRNAFPSISDPISGVLPADARKRLALTRERQTNINNTHIRNRRGPQHKDLRSLIVYGRGASSPLCSGQEPLHKEHIGWGIFRAFLMFICFFRS